MSYIFKPIFLIIIVKIFFRKTIVKPLVQGVQIPPTTLNDTFCIEILHSAISNIKNRDRKSDIPVRLVKKADL